MSNHCPPQHHQPTSHSFIKMHAACKATTPLTNFSASSNHLTGTSLPSTKLGAPTSENFGPRRKRSMSLLGLATSTQPGALHALFTNVGANSYVHSVQSTSALHTSISTSTHESCASSLHTSHTQGMQTPRYSKFTTYCPPLHAKHETSTDTSH